MFASVTGHAMAVIDYFVRPFTSDARTVPGTGR